MKTQFYDLSIDTLDDGTIRLEQHDYCGESVLLDLHLQQVLHIANGLAVDTHRIPANGTAERIATLERRMCWMRDRFKEARAAAPADMFERCHEAFEFDAWIQASIDVATEYCADFPNAPSNALASPKEASSLPLGDGSQPSATGRDDGPSGRRDGDLFPALDTEFTPRSTE